jgi:hypothetical protein
MFEPPDYVYQKALEKVEKLRSESELRRLFPGNSWRHIWAQRLRDLANRLEPEPFFNETSAHLNPQK